MTTFTMHHDTPQVATRAGYGIAALDMQGRFVEIPGTIPLGRTETPSWPSYGPLRGDGRELSAIGQVYKDEVHEASQTEHNLPEPVQIIEAYRICRSVDTTARRFRISRHYVTRLLVEHGIQLGKMGGRRKVAK